MGIQEIYEQRAGVATEMRRLAKIANGDPKDWTRDREEEFGKANKEYDRLTAIIRSGEVDEELEKLVEPPLSPNPPDYTPAPRPQVRDLPGAAAQPGSVQFRDSAGREVRGYRHGENLCSDQDQPNLGRCLYAAITGDIDSLEARDQIGGIDSQGGFWLSGSVSAKLIDLARANSVAMKAGALTVPMPTRELTLVRVTADPTAQWLAEGVAGTPSSATLGALVLQAKTLRVNIPVAIELLQDSANAPQAIESVVRASFGSLIDAAILTGTGAGEPQGISNTSAVNTLDFGGNITSTNGWNKLNEAVEHVLIDNYPGEISALALVAHPATFQILDGLADTTNQPLNPTPWMVQVRKFATTTMTSPDDGTAILGDFTQVVLGVRQAISVQVLDAGTNEAGSNAVDSFQRVIRVSFRGDVGIMQPTWLCNVTNIDEA